MSQSPLVRPIGLVLTAAGLISNPQLEVALRDQQNLVDVRLGEILALHGWLKQETADFFAEQWPILVFQPKTEPIGAYFQKAALLTEAQIQELLLEQKHGQTWIRFGALAVFLGYLKQETVNFFLNSLKKKSPPSQDHSQFDPTDDQEIPWVD